jgi:hypothetical protein
MSAENIKVKTAGQILDFIELEALIDPRASYPDQAAVAINP